jgi:ribonuclease BN (tRNA processing enzyme)
MSEFSVKFRGVRGSFPVANKNFLNFGGNTSCVEVNVGGHLIILDAGTGIINVGDDLMEKYLASAINPEERTPINAIILISHIHQDHLLGLTFFKPLHIKSTNLSIYGCGSSDSNLKTNLSELIFGKTFPIDLGETACNLEITDLIKNKAILLKKSQRPQIVDIKDLNIEEDDVLITFYKSYVHPREGVMIYKITYKGKSVVYATDKECYFGGDRKFSRFAKDCDLLIHDTQYTTEDYLSPYSPKQGYGHSTYDMAIEVMKQTKAKNLAFFHYDPSYDDFRLSRVKERYTLDNKNIIMSYEGLEINIL